MYRSAQGLFAKYRQTGSVSDLTAYAAEMKRMIAAGPGWSDPGNLKKPGLAESLFNNAVSRTKKLSARVGGEVSPMRASEVRALEQELDALRVFDVFQVLLDTDRPSMATYNYNRLVLTRSDGYASTVGVMIFIMILIFTVLYVRFVGIERE